MDNIKVAIKVRPLIKRERDENLPIQWEVQENRIAPVDPELKKRSEPFIFDHIFDVCNTNFDVFNVIAKPIVEAAINGINGTIFAYGQTSSGKTYTMMGEATYPGVIPLAVDYIFDKITNSYDREFLLRVAFIEIYNEKVNNLLDKKGVDLKLKEEKSGQVSIACKEEIATSSEFVLSLMRKGLKNRRIGETNMNDRSSRSHTIFRITIESREPNSDGAVQVSQLNLVDLAGSERPKQSGATGDRFNEGRHINMSLSALSLVIMQLSETQENPQRYVNFRDSKLTRILQSSLGGNAMTTIICAVTPAVFDETQQTLAFASRAKKVKNKPEVNEVVSDAALLQRYAKQLAKLKVELQKAQCMDLVEMESKLMEKESKLMEKESKLKEKDRAYQLLEERIALLKTRIISGCRAPEDEKSNRKLRRRRTWGGLGAYSSSLESIGLPTIKEVEKTSPEKKTKIDPKHKKKRQSIIETIDIFDETFRTEFTDFELELIESDRERNRLSDLSTSAEEYYVTKPRRTVQFMDDVIIMGNESKSLETTPEKTNSESPPGTPKKMLRSRINFLMEQYNTLTMEYKALEEFTKLEKQMFVEEAVEVAMAEHNKKLEELQKSLADSERSRKELLEKCTNLQNHSSKSNEKLEALQRDLVETMNLLKTLRNEKDSIIEELNTLKASKTVSTVPMDVSVDKESSSVFANATYFDNINISDSQCDDLMINDDECTENLLINDSILMKNVTIPTSDDSKRFDDSNKMFDNEYFKQISEKTREELIRVVQDLVNTKISLEEENVKLEATLRKKIREADDVKNDIRELKSGIEKLQETIQILTTENTELTTKLTTEKESATEARKSFQSTIAELNSSIYTMEQEKIAMEQSFRERENPNNDETISNLVNKYEKTIATLTAKNEELSTDVMKDKIEESNRPNELRIESSEHDCEYRRLANDLAERNKQLESEYVQQSKDLMEKIEEYDHMKELYDSIASKFVIASLPEKSSCLVNISMNCPNLVGNNISSPNDETNEIKKNDYEREDRQENGIVTSPVSHHTVDDLLRFSLTGVNTTEKFNSSNGRSIDDLLRMSVIRKDLDEVGHEACKHKVEMLQAQLEALTILNKKLSDFKLTSCKQCAHVVELKDNRKMLQNEIKSLNRTLEELQMKFEREYADTKILRTKASEELDLSICDASFSMDGVNVSLVEERVQSLHEEIESLRTKHERLSELYREKCEEIDKLHDSSLRELTSPTSGMDSPRLKRNDPRLEKLEAEMEKSQSDLRNLKKNITRVSMTFGKFTNEKHEFENKLKESETINHSLKDKCDSLEKRIVYLNSELEEYKIAKEQLENEKSSQTSEIESLKNLRSSENHEFENKLREVESINNSLKDKCDSLEKRIVCLNSELEEYKVAKEQLENEKSSETSEIESLKNLKSNEEHEFENKLREIETINNALKDKCDSLEKRIVCLNSELEEYKIAKEQLENEKSSQMSEIESLKIEKQAMQNEIASEKAVLLSAREKITLLEKEVTRLNSETTKYEARTKEANDENIESLQQKVTQLVSEVENLNVVKNNLKETRLSLENEISCLVTSKERNDFPNQNETLLLAEKKIETLQSEITRLEALIVKSNERVKELEEAQSWLDNKAQSLKTENEAYEEKLSTREINPSVKSQLEADKASLESQVDELITEKTVHTEVLQELQRSLQTLEEENSVLRAKIATNVDIKLSEEKTKVLELILEEYTRDLAENEKIIGNLKEMLEHANADKLTLTSKFEMLGSKFQDAINDLKARDEANIDLKKKIEYFESYENRLLEDKCALVNKVKDLKNEITSLQENSSVLRQMVHKLEQSEQPKWNGSTTNEKNDKDSKESSYQNHKEYDKMLDELRGKLEIVKNELRSSTKELKAMNDAKLSLEGKVESLNSEKSELFATIENLRKTVSELEDKNEKLNEELQVLSSFKYSPDSNDRYAHEKKIEELSAQLEKLSNELDNLSRENNEYREKIIQLENSALASERSVDDDSEKSYEYERRELEMARKFITKEITSLKSSSEDLELSKKTTSELIEFFVTTIMSKEQEVVAALRNNFEREKRRLEESKSQSLDVERRASSWARELEREVEKIQQDLARQEVSNGQLSEKIAMLENSLRESNHENQMLKDKIQALQADFDTIDDSDKSVSSSRRSGSLNGTQEKPRENVDTLEMELRSKLRQTEKRYKEKVDELTSSLEHQKTRNLELTNNIEGLEANEKQLRNIVDMRTNELSKCNATIERIGNELSTTRELYDQVTRENAERGSKIDEITSLLKSKCDILSEYKTKLETIAPEYEKLREQANERQFKLEKYRSEIECLKEENQRTISELKDRLDSEEINSASYRKQLADLTNRNSSLQMVIIELRTKCNELEIANERMAKSMRNSTSKIRVEEEMNELRDRNSTLERNLDGAGNRINELQDMKTNLMKDLSDLRVRFESVNAENLEMRRALSLYGPTSTDGRKYEELLQEKNRIELELIDKRSRLERLEKKMETLEREAEQLKLQNSELETDMEECLARIQELTKESSEFEDKFYQSEAAVESYQSKIKQLNVINDDLESRIKNCLEEIEELKSRQVGAVFKGGEPANEGLSSSKYGQRDRSDTLTGGDNERSSSPILESIRADSRRRRSRNDLFNLNRPLEVLDKNEEPHNCRCEALKKQNSQLDKEIALKNAKIATLELKIHSEIFPHVRKCKDLEEILAGMKKKNKALEAQCKKLEEMRIKEMSNECERCKKWRNNKRDQASQSLPGCEPIYMSGMSSGIIDGHVKVQKLEKEKAFLKTICRNRQEVINELNERIKELENRCSGKVASEENPRSSSTLNSNSRADSASIPRQAMKENVPAIWSNQRQPSVLKRDPSWFT